MKKLIGAALLALASLEVHAQTFKVNNLAVNTGVSIGPAAASLVKPLTVSQAVTGTTSGNCTTDTLIMYPCANLFYVSSDNASAGTTGQSAYDEWQFAANFGGSNLTGARQTMDVIAHFTAPSSASNVNTGYDAAAFEMITNSGDGGTAPNTTNGRGSFFATNPLVIANSGAQNLFGIAGEEIDVGCNGCSTAIRFGVSAANFGTTQAAVPVNDAAYHVGSIGSGTTGSWHQALNLSHVNGGAPLDSTGCVICTDTNNDTIATGIDLHSYNITGNLLIGPNGLQITGAAAIVAPGGIGTTGGIAINAGGLAVTGGIVVNSGAVGLKVLTVATLPACAAGLKGQLYGVSDATSPTYNATVTGGGAVSVPVYCNGTNWTAH